MYPDGLSVRSGADVKGHFASLSSAGYPLAQCTEEVVAGTAERATECERVVAVVPFHNVPRKKLTQIIGRLFVFGQLRNHGTAKGGLYRKRSITLDASSCVIHTASTGRWGRGT